MSAAGARDPGRLPSSGRAGSSALRLGILGSVDLERVLLVGGSVGGLLVLAWTLLLLDGQGVDAYAYWRAAHGDPYAVAYGTGAFHYAPPVALALTLLAPIPWPAFYWLLTATSLVLLASIGRRWTFALIALPPVAFELFHGNIHLILAAVIVGAVRRPWLWSVVAVTKVLPAVGLLWYVVRGEWRSLAIAVGTTAALAVGSLVLAPDLWAAWLGHLGVADGLAGPAYLALPLPVRLALAAAVIVWGARTDRPWTLPVAATLALPILWLNGLAVLVALLPIVSRTRDDGIRAR